MEIENIKHKTLRKFIETGKGRGLIQQERVLDMVSFIVNAGQFSDLATPPNFGFHALTGNLKGAFAMTVTKNWRLTFTKIDEHTIADLNLEDYH